jgi:hypothetical protein
MSLIAYTITALELNQSDATTSGKQVVIGASCSMYIQPADTAVLLYDNAAGSNGSTAKSTGADGQVTVYIESGDYRVSTNSVSRYITVTSIASLPTFGTAATADVTTNVLDTTAGRLTKVGDYGVGASHLNSAGNFNDVTLSGLYSFTSGATGEPISSAINTTLVMKTGDSTIGTELNIRGNPIGGNDIRAHIRGYDTSDPTQNTSWAELWHSENLNYLQNTSGSTSASNATVGGSSLTPTQTGTWRNVSGGDILDNGYGLWSKV